MKKIPLTQGKFALVSDKDYEYLNQWKWQTLKCHSSICYAVRTFFLKIERKHKTIYMHRVIAERMNIKNPDHKDTDGLNNQRSNLREATYSQQSMNRNLRSDNKSVYKGVYWRKDTKKWRACITVYTKRINLGCFDAIKDAAKAYNKAAIKYFGEFAVLNKV